MRRYHENHQMLTPTNLNDWLNLESSFYTARLEPVIHQSLGFWILSSLPCHDFCLLNAIGLSMFYDHRLF